MEQTEQKQDGAIERLFAVGAHYGYSKRKRHPSVSDFIFGTKNRTEIIDLTKTNEQFEKAKTFVRGLGEKGKQVLFVGGKNEAQSVVLSAAESAGAPFVTGRWIGGTLTNFGEIRKRVGRLTDLTDKREKGEFESKYTKHERLMIDREIEGLENLFGGVVSMKEHPAALIVVDTKHEHTAVREANRLGIPIVGLMNSDCNVDDVTYPIVGNDAARKSIEFFINALAEAYREGQKKHGE